MIKDPKGVAIQRRQMSPNYSILSVSFRDYNKVRMENEMLRKALAAVDGMSPMIGKDYHVILETERVCIYFTLDGNPSHYVVYDSMDETA